MGPPPIAVLNAGRLQQASGTPMQLYKWPSNSCFVAQSSASPPIEPDWPVLAVRWRPAASWASRRFLVEGAQRQALHPLHQPRLRRGNHGGLRPEKSQNFAPAATATNSQAEALPTLKPSADEALISCRLAGMVDTWCRCAATPPSR